MAFVGPVVALDIGGTKVHGALVDRRGKILRRIHEPALIQEGPKAFFSHLRDVVSRLSEGTSAARVGIGCAGPLDGRTGELLDPTNFFTGGKSWGRLSLGAPLKKRWPRKRFFLENDAAAAVLAESWLGGGETDDLVVMTLGTGVGVGVLTDGRLTRVRGGLHPEASHITLDYRDEETPCGCGNFGCIEAYLAGAHFIRRLSERWKEPGLTGAELIARAKEREPRVIAAFGEYSQWLAQALHAYAVLYGPKRVSLSGGFAVAAPWFLPKAKARLKELLARRREGEDLLPDVAVSRLGNDLGVLGAARVAYLAQ